jgi:hypothetical protein
MSRRCGESSTAVREGLEQDRKSLGHRRDPFVIQDYGPSLAVTLAPRRRHGKLLHRKSMEENNLGKNRM